MSEQLIVTGCRNSRHSRIFKGAEYDVFEHGLTADRIELDDIFRSPSVCLAGTCRQLLNRGCLRAEWGVGRKGGRGVHSRRRS